MLVHKIKTFNNFNFIKLNIGKSFNIRLKNIRIEKLPWKALDILN